jgi:hypothetical protein
MSSVVLLYGGFFFILLSVFAQDLESLSAGLEGRSDNPVALLFDTLLRPNTDLDSSHPSSLRWEYHPDKAVPHVVVGRGDPGGCWQFMDPLIKTLSLDKWLELPLYSFQDWKSDQSKKDMTDVSGPSPDVYGRVLCGEVAQYYSDYVTKMGLGGNFINDTEIIRASTFGKKSSLVGTPPSPANCTILSSSPPTLHTCTTRVPLDSLSSHSPVSSPSSPSSSLLSPVSPIGLCPSDEATIPMAAERLMKLCSFMTDREDCGIICNQGRTLKPRWCLSGSQREVGGNHLEKNVCILSQKLVLACGVFGNPRRLDVPGERDVETSLAYTLLEFSSKLCSGATSGVERTVMVVGAGLSAADAVLQALRKGVKVLHVFKRDPLDEKLIFSRMSKKVYPGYQYVHELMLGQESNPNYLCFARSEVTLFRGSSVTISSMDRSHTKLLENVELGGVFLGSNARLDFLPEKLVGKLGSISDSEEINAKHNPIAVDEISFVTEALSSLYAIGSLAGDNFVRFGVGSALGAAQHIIKSY